MSNDQAPMQLTEEQKRSRRSRNIALGIIIAGLVVLFYVITVVKLGGNVLQRGGM
jgi:high-affinity K+ transport system ATPase subunit B